MKKFKFASLSHPTYTSPEFFCTDSDLCEDVLKKIETTFKKSATFTRNDLSGKVVNFKLELGGFFSSEKWFEASTWLLQYLLERGWEPFAISTEEHGLATKIHLRIVVDDSEVK